MPRERELKLMRDFFMKYYGKTYVKVFDDAVQKNKIYLKKIINIILIFNKNKKIN
jgi:hypothetical protein